MSLPLDCVSCLRRIRTYRDTNFYSTAATHELGTHLPGDDTLLLNLTYTVQDARQLHSEFEILFLFQFWPGLSSTISLPINVARYVNDEPDLNIHVELWDQEIYTNGLVIHLPNSH